MTLPRVSVVIPTYERRESLLRALAALETQDIAPDEYEVVVVVDGSTDGTREAVESLGTRYALRICSQENRGRAAACNAGVAAATGSLVVLLDDDMIASRALLSAHLQAHEVHPRLAVIGAAPVEVTPDLALPASYVGRKFNRHLERLASEGGPVGLRDFYSGNLSIARELLLEVGGFDEGFTRYGNEDLELSVRLRAIGVRIVYEPRAIATQTYDKEFVALAHDNVSKGRTAVLLALKHPAVRGQLKIGTSRGEPLMRRAALTCLLSVTRVAPALRERVLHTMSRLTLRDPALAEQLYPLTLDYFYHCGANDERRALRKKARA